jgi:hypothetical protein
MSLSRKISFSQLGDLLQKEWEKGTIGEEAYESIQDGLLPIRYLREQLRWIIEREGNGLRLTIDSDDDKGYRISA